VKGLVDGAARQRSEIDAEESAAEEDVDRAARLYGDRAMQKETTPRRTSGLRYAIGAGVR